MQMRVVARSANGINGFDASMGDVANRSDDFIIADWDADTADRV